MEHQNGVLQVVFEEPPTKFVVSPNAGAPGVESRRCRAASSSPVPATSRFELDMSRSTSCSIASSANSSGGKPFSFQSRTESRSMIVACYLERGRQQSDRYDHELRESISDAHERQFLIVAVEDGIDALRYIRPIPRTWSCSISDCRVCMDATCNARWPRAARRAAFRRRRHRQRYTASSASDFNGLLKPVDPDSLLLTSRMRGRAHQCPGDAVLREMLRSRASSSSTMIGLLKFLAQFRKSRLQREGRRQRRRR